MKCHVFTVCARQVGAFFRENQILEYVILTAGGASRLPPFTFQNSIEMQTLYEVYQAIGTTGDTLADDLCASFAAASESERSALRSQRPDIFEERNYPLADEKPGIELAFFAVQEVPTWSENYQYAFHGTWAQIVAVANILAFTTRRKVRVSTSHGFENQGHYFNS